MSSEPVLVARGIGKCYQTYRRPFDRLKQALLGGRGHKYYREFWALRDLDLELQRGAAVGIIGRNGSGKSTLLQILAGTLQPTTGTAEIHGRVGALLELGSGFNPEFTGRENVHLQGTLLGFRPAEVRQRFGEIEAFADIGQFIDEPVKTYSSGMFVRLAFAVQVVLAPEVLIVDEALSVGDAAFQIKCMTHMRRLLERGMSVILASHDVDTVRGLCGEAVWIHEGRVRARGGPKETTAAYLRFLFDGDPPAVTSATAAGTTGAATLPAAGVTPELPPPSERGRWGSGAARVTEVRLTSPGSSAPAGLFANGERLRLEVEFKAERDLDGRGLGAAFSLRNLKGLNLITFATHDVGRRLQPLPRGGSVRFAFEFDNILPAGEYGLVVAVEEVVGGERRYCDFIESAMILRVTADLPSFSVVAPPIAHELMIAGSSPKEATR